MRGDFGGLFDPVPLVGRFCCGECPWQALIDNGGAPAALAHERTKGHRVILVGSSRDQWTDEPPPGASSDDASC